MSCESTDRRLEQLEQENAELRVRLDEAEETLRAIREGEVDAVIVRGSQGRRVVSLLETDHLYRRMLEAMDEAGLATSLDGTLVFANARASALLAPPGNQLAGRSLYEFVAAEDAERLRHLLHQAQVQPAHGRMVLLAADGTLVRMHASAYPLEHTDGKRICCVATDVSRIEATVAELARSEERYRVLFESSRDALCVVNLASPADVACNRAFLEMFGIADEAESRKYRPLDFSPRCQPDGRLSEEAAREIIARTIRDGNSLFEWRHRRSNGEEFPATVLMTVVALDDVRYLHATIRDVTAQKHAEQELQWLNETLERRVQERTVELKRANEELSREVKERARAEAALRDSEALTRTILDNLPIGIAVNSINPPVHFEYMNDLFPRIYRTTREALAGCDAFWDAVYEDAEFRNQLKTRVLADCASGDPARMFWEDVPIVRKGSETAYVTARNIPLPNRHMMVSTVWDVTERKRAEEQLIQNEQTLRSVLESYPESMFLIDSAGTILYANRTFGERLNRASADLTGANVYDLLPATVAQSRRIPVDQVVGTGEPLRFTDERYGRVMEITVAPIRDADGHISRLAILEIDITERIAAEASMRLKEQAIASSLNAIVICDADARLTYVNPAFLRLSDYRDEASVLGRSVEEFSQTPEAARNVVRALRDHDTWFGELTGRRRDGSSVEVLVSASVVRAADGEPTHMTASILDISERKRAEQQRLAIEAQLRHSQRLESIGTLAGGVAHEINNPVTGIMNYAQLILDRLDPASDVAEFAAEIGVESQRIATIVKNLLTFAREEKQQHSPARMVDVVTSVLSLVRTILRHDQIAVAVDIPEDLPAIQCRSQQIQQVIMNLVTNARDALNARYPAFDENKTIRIAARKLDRHGQAWICLTVEDQGVGIAPEIRDRLFDPFFTTKCRSGGTGLGLSISYGIVHDHHGELRVDSEEGQCTRVHVHLPVDNKWELGGDGAEAIIGQH